MSVLRVRDIEMAFDDSGRGQPVVLLHGFPLNRSMWGEQVEALGKSYRVIAPDLRGHGGTTVPDEPATMEESAHDVAALLDELGIESASVGGLSMGGYVALAFARLYPQRVSSLVLADTRAGADSDEARRGREESARGALEKGINVIAEAMLPKLLSPATLAQKPDTVARVREMMTSTQPAGAAAALRGMALRRDQRSFLSEISGPTLILVGGDDNLTPPSEASLMHQAIRGSRMTIIEKAAHLSNVEQPEEFNHALLNFLGDVYSARSALDVER